MFIKNYEELLNEMEYCIKTIKAYKKDQEFLKENYKSNSPLMEMDYKEYLDRLRELDNHILLHKEKLERLELRKKGYNIKKEIRNKLYQYNSLSAEIKELDNELRRLEEKIGGMKTDVVQGSSDTFPYGLKSFFISGYNLEDTSILSSKKKNLMERKVKAEELQIEIGEFINSIDDSIIRRVFQYRYIDKKEWKDVSEKLGSNDESYSRKIHDRYIEKIFSDEI